MATTLLTKSKPTTENNDSKAATGATSSDRRHSAETGVVHVDKHRPFVLMEELMEKLKCVNYDIDFCCTLGYKPISRCGSYFVFEISPQSICGLCHFAG